MSVFISQFILGCSVCVLKDINVFGGRHTMHFSNKENGAHWKLWNVLDTGGDGGRQVHDGERPARAVHAPRQVHLPSRARHVGDRGTSQSGRRARTGGIWTLIAVDLNIVEKFISFIGSIQSASRVKKKKKRLCNNMIIGPR